MNIIEYCFCDAAIGFRIRALQSLTGQPLAHELDANQVKAK
jgi:hypothetical protein